jgi:hypothetical protein
MANLRRVLSVVPEHQEDIPAPRKKRATDSQRRYPSVGFDLRRAADREPDDSFNGPRSVPAHSQSQPHCRVNEDIPRQSSARSTGTAPAHSTGPVSPRPRPRSMYDGQYPPAPGMLAPPVPPYGPGRASTLSSTSLGPPTGPVTYAYPPYPNPYGAPLYVPRLHNIAYWTDYEMEDKVRRNMDGYYNSAGDPFDAYTRRQNSPVGGRREPRDPGSQHSMYEHI